MPELPEGTKQSWAWKTDSELEKVLVSNPPSGKHKVVNIYWDEDLQKITVEKLTEPEP